VIDQTKGFMKEERVKKGDENRLGSHLSFPPCTTITTSITTPSTTAIFNRQHTTRRMSPTTATLDDEAISALGLSPCHADAIPLFLTSPQEAL